MPPTSRQSQSHQSKPAKRKAEAISTSITTDVDEHPTQSGFTISSLPTNLTQSTPKPALPAPPPSNNARSHPQQQNSPPLPSEATHLSTTHDLTTLSILSSTPITKRVSRVLDILSQWPAKQNEKERVVMLYANGEVGGKLISIIEIIKREIASKGGKWFQYTVVEGRREEVKKKERRREVGERKGNAKGNEEEEEDEDAFEVMKTPFERAIEGQPKIREVPILIVFLSRVSIDFLRKKYGEQTNCQSTKRTD